jgi:transposase
LINYLLTKQELDELKRMHKLCKKRTEADRVKAVYLLGKGWSVVEVAEALLLEDDAIRRYFQLYKAGGVGKLLENNHVGKLSFITARELELLEAHLTEHTYLTVGEIIEYVKEEFDIEYTDTGMRYVLYQLNFVYKKPEKVPFRVDEKAQKNFIRRYQAIKRRLTQDDGLYFMDATHPEHTAIASHGWIKRGERKPLKSNPRPYRLNINGAINISTLNMVVRFEDKINKETVLDFLETLRNQQPKGWIYLFCDNAGYYQSLEVKLYAKSLAIKLVYLPAYSPNLNLIERIWKFFKKKTLYNKHYPHFSDMVNASKTFFQKIGQYQNELKTLMAENFQVIKI